MKTSAHRLKQAHRLQRLGLLDTETEVAFVGLTQLAASVTGVPMSVIPLIFLIDPNRY